MKIKNLAKIIALVAITLSLVAVAFMLGSCGSSCEHRWVEQAREYGNCTVGDRVDYCCELCGDIKTETLDAPGHTVVVEPGYPSTCTVNGVSDREYCEVCGETIKAAEYIITMTVKLRCLWDSATLMTHTSRSHTPSTV